MGDLNNSLVNYQNSFQTWKNLYQLEKIANKSFESMSSEQLKLTEYYATSLCNVGVAYYKLGEMKNYKESLRYFNESQEILRKIQADTNENTIKLVNYIALVRRAIIDSEDLLNSKISEVKQSNLDGSAEAVVHQDNLSNSSGKQNNVSWKYGEIGQYWNC